MEKTLHYFTNGFIIALFLLQSACGAIQLGWHMPNTDQEDWKAWELCTAVMSSPSTGIKHDVFCLEDTNFKGTNPKPPVLLLHEMSGLTPQTFRYAMELSDDFTVYIPMLFGDKGKASFLNWKGLWEYWGWFGNEWSVPPKGSAPIVRWLRDVVSNIERKHGSSPMRIIGNCMTGALPLALLSKEDRTVDAVVVAQAALPMRFWASHTDEDYSSLGLSDDDLELARSSKAEILALRYETDRVSPPAKLKTLQSEFGARLHVAEICVRDYDPTDKHMRPHSTLIGEYDAVHEKVRKLSKNARETVRKFLLDPTDPAFGHSSCASKGHADSTLDSAR